MFSETDFTIMINGREYRVEIDDGSAGAHRGLFRVTDAVLRLEVTNQIGQCNPLLSFWAGPDSLLTGAARASKILSIIHRAAVQSLHELAEYRAELLACDEIVPDETNALLAAAGL